MSEQIRTLKELKYVIDELVEKGKGDWPVVHKASEGPVYTPVQIHAIDPDKSAPFKGLELDSSFIDAPSGKHVLIDFDQYE